MSVLKGSERASRERLAADGRKTAGHRGEKGFALPMVLFIITILAVLGATTMLIAVYAMKNAQATLPAAKAFDIAEAGVALGHAKLTTENDPAGTYTLTDMGGTCQVTVAGANPDWTITATSNYQEGGETFRRRIEERVNYTSGGLNAFSFMQNYIMYAGRNLNLTAGDVLNLGAPMTVNGNIRADNDIVVVSSPGLGVGDSLVINGNVEGGNSAYLESNVDWIALASDLHVNGNVLSDGNVTLRANGLHVLFRFQGWLYVTFVKCRAASVNIIEDNGEGVSVGGTETSWTGWKDVNRLEPDFDYYKAVAKRQGNYVDGDLTLTGSLGSGGESSITVYYATGDINIGSSGTFSFDLPDMTGIFVCEGNFTANNTTLMKFNQNSKFQVVAMGDCNFECSWDFFGFGGTTDQFFFYAGNDANINTGMFSGMSLSVSAGRDISVISDNLFGTPTINSNPDFAIDVRAWPVEMKVVSWKELPVE